LLSNIFYHYNNSQITRRIGLHRENCRSGRLIADQITYIRFVLLERRILKLNILNTLLITALHEVMFSTALVSSLVSCSV